MAVSDVTTAAAGESTTRRVSKGLVSGGEAEKVNQAFSYAKKTDSNDIVSKDTFLMMMIEKMSNQDPLDPTDDSEFLTQLAQYTTLEQMINMTETIAMQQGFDMVGKNVIIEHGDTFYSGTVDSVIRDGGKIKLDVGGLIVDVDAVKEVLSQPYQGDIMEEIGGNLTDGE